MLLLRPKLVLVFAQGEACEWRVNVDVRPDAVDGRRPHPDAGLAHPDAGLDDPDGRQPDAPLRGPDPAAGRRQPHPRGQHPRAVERLGPDQRQHAPQVRRRVAGRCRWLRTPAPPPPPKLGCSIVMSI